MSSHRSNHLSALSLLVATALAVSLLATPASAVPASCSYQNPPVVTSVDPDSGPASGGTTVTVHGANFLSGMTVKFDGVSGTATSRVDASTMTTKTPAHAAGSVTVTVASTCWSGSLAGGYTFLPGPHVTSVTPTSGTSDGGVLITITGTDFQAGATVKLGGTAATSVTVQSATTITATTPPHSAGAVDLVVTGPDGQTSTLAHGFTYTAAPTITTIAPSGGLTAGGDVVVITGTGFGTGPAVHFGGLEATVTSSSGTSITVRTPAHPAGAVLVTVTTTSGQEATKVDGYLYDTDPHLTAVTPTTSSISGGTSITLTGTGFSPSATVTIGGTAATSVVVANSGSITAKTPAHAAGDADVVVTNPDGKTATLVGAMHFVAPPGSFTVSPTSGFTPGGTSVTLTGSDFQQGATVRVGGSAGVSVQVLSPSLISFKTPPHGVGTVDIVVTNPDGQTSSRPSAFTYVPAAAPTVSAVAPGSGALQGGTQITITGSGFLPGASVMVGGTPAVSVVVASGTQITATTPAGAAGGATVLVANPDGQVASLAGAFTYRGASQAARAPEDIERANEEVKVDVKRVGNDNEVHFELPSDLPDDAAGVQVWSSNSPFKWVADIEAGSAAFDAGTYTDVGAPATTKYLVTVYYGTTASDGYSANHKTSDIPGFSTLGTGVAAASASSSGPALLVVLGVLILVAIIALAVVFAVRRRKAAPETSTWAAATPGVSNNALYRTEPTPPVERSIRCPDCQTSFTAQGSLPLLIHCVSCGKRGTLVG